MRRKTANSGAASYGLWYNTAVSCIHHLVRLNACLICFSSVVMIVSGVSPYAAAETPPLATRPKIAVVLEGGGAKGFAHVGVLRVLEEARVPVDLIVGTSMGAIVGAAFASGRTIDEMEDELSKADWDALFREAPPRSEVTYRQKSGRERELYGDAKLGILDGKLVFPTAFIQGQKLEPLFMRLYGKVPSVTSFDDLPIPFRAVAADIETGEAVVLDRGSISTATRASMSVPGVFSPVEVDGRLLVDGGITNNLPVDVALALGADIIIAVECVDRLRGREELKSYFDVSGQILALLLERSTQNGLKLLRPGDVHIGVETAGYGSSDFIKARELMSLGETSARNQKAQLLPFQVDQKTYAAYHARRTKGSELKPIIRYVEVEEAPAHLKQRIADAFTPIVGQPLDRKNVEDMVQEVYYRYDMKKVGYEVTSENDGHGLHIKAEAKEWLKNYARIGFSLEDDFNGQSNYSLALNGRINEINERGGYLDIQLEAGRSPRAQLELYQRIDKLSNFFVAPEISYSQQDILVRDEDTIAAEYQREEATAALKAGYSFQEYGELLTGWRWGRGRVDRRIGDESLRDFKYDIGELFSRLVLDQFDNPDFPTEGYRAALGGTLARDGLGASNDYELASGIVSVPFTQGPFTLLLSAEAGIAPGDLPPERYSSFGGFFDVSGFEQGSLIANDFWASRAALYYRVFKGTSPLLPFGGYLGSTFEVVSLESDLESVPDRRGIVAGSVFVGADTPFLPVYLGFGIADESEQSLYLTVGRLQARRR